MVRRALTVLLILMSLPSWAGEVPSSPRSDTAVAEATARLKPELARHGFKLGAPIFIRIFKQEKELEVWLKNENRFSLFRTYPICTYSGQLGPKLAEGDGQAPEGFYTVTAGHMNPASSYHLSFNLGFPNAYDQAQGRTGSLLMVHGDCVSIGCFAMAKRRLPYGADRNHPIEEIWTLMHAAFRTGQPAVQVHALPFRMTAKNLHDHQSSKWFDFWQNLAEGNAIFEQTHQPPRIQVQGGRYSFQ